jgi:hypothetical protein
MGTKVEKKLKNKPSPASISNSFVPRNRREFAHKHLDTLKTANNHCF